MPKEPVDLIKLRARIRTNAIKKDLPLFIFKDVEDKEFYFFQDSGLNVLLGAPGNGKTKCLTWAINELLKNIRDPVHKYYGSKIVYIDTERPESQYAQTIDRIMEKSCLSEDQVVENLIFISALDLSPSEIRDALAEILKNNPFQIFIIVVDHMLSLVMDMNSTQEAPQVELFLKKLISDGHLLLTTIHTPYSNLQKGLGHLGSALDRLASFSVEISNNDSDDGFKLVPVKSRISAKSKIGVILFMDSSGFIDTNITPKTDIIDAKKKSDRKIEALPDIIDTFSRSINKTKKQLLVIIKNKMGYSDSSSSDHTFYNELLADCIVFDNDTHTITERGLKYITKNID